MAFDGVVVLLVLLALCSITFLNAPWALGLEVEGLGFGTARLVKAAEDRWLTGF